MKGICLGRYEFHGEVRFAAAITPFMLSASFHLVLVGVTNISL
jgi:hypothetical protein